MIDEFLKTIKSGLTDQLTAKSTVESSNLEGIANVVTDTFKDGMLDKVKKGKLGDIADLLGDGGSSSPFAGILSNNVVSNLISKLGLPKDISNTIATIAVPFIIEKFNSFASDKGVSNKEGIGDLMGDLVKSSIKDKFLEGKGGLLGGLGKKFGF